MCLHHPAAEGLLRWPPGSSRTNRNDERLEKKMKADKRPEYITRDTILKLLSDEEIARVSTAEAAIQLADGEEYVDLEEPDQGVRRALGKAAVPMGHVLPRKAVHEHTWRQIVGLLSAHEAEASSHSHN